MSTVDAMRAFFPAQRNIIDDTFQNTGKTLVAQRGESRRALTLDNGPNAYPTILYSYERRPADCLIIAHEFGHAIQMRASRGKFVPPIMREVCAFIGELALLSHAQTEAAHHSLLLHAWERDNRKYLGTDRDELCSALSRPETAYSYAWNYPIARYFAIEIARQFSRDRIWTLFEGDLSIGTIVGELEPGSA